MVMHAMHMESTIMHGYGQEYIISNVLLVWLIMYPVSQSRNRVHVQGSLYLLGIKVLGGRLATPAPTGSRILC